ncbi:hypothetical protein PVAP13_7NG011896 [Panicum virgatum]|uniref:Uncharacterized protein n=1 Tax=Panicum virgatum TaxID=38727 RepID=A0A8T0Q6E4_PANVG|nr:hypothetical protein PVAP13_7NG011872 [Panicum virgatum]KAG2568289.1 hypothetical protein PVAP13_7NG011896 [Panicum virgatum]
MPMSRAPSLASVLATSTASRTRLPPPVGAATPPPALLRHGGCLSTTKFHRPVTPILSPTPDMSEYLCSSLPSALAFFLLRPFWFFRLHSRLGAAAGALLATPFPFILCLILRFMKSSCISRGSRSFAASFSVQCQI